MDGLGGTAKSEDGCVLCGVDGGEVGEGAVLEGSPLTGAGGLEGLVWLGLSINRSAGKKDGV